MYSAAAGYINANITVVMSYLIIMISVISMMPTAAGSTFKGDAAMRQVIPHEDAHLLLSQELVIESDQIGSIL